MSGTIPLTQGHVATVDDEDFLWLSQHKWQAARKREHFYATRSVRKSNGKKTTLSMHREILLRHRVDLDGLVVDHKSGNTLDNRKCNIRPATYSQNSYNSPEHEVGESGYRGVRTSLEKWQAGISVDDRNIHLGTYDTPEEAARVRDLAAIKHHGEFAVLNFPDDHRSE